MELFSVDREEDFGFFKDQGVVNGFLCKYFGLNLQAVKDAFKGIDIVFFLQNIDYDKIIIREKISKIFFIIENENEFLSNCLDIDHHMGIMKSHLNYSSTKELINEDILRVMSFNVGDIVQSKHLNDLTSCNELRGLLISFNLSIMSLLILISPQIQALDWLRKFYPMIILK